MIRSCTGFVSFHSGNDSGKSHHPLNYWNTKRKPTKTRLLTFSRHWGSFNKFTIEFYRLPLIFPAFYFVDVISLVWGKKLLGNLGNWKAQSKNDPLIFRPFLKVFRSSWQLLHFQKWPKNQGIVLALSPPIKDQLNYRKAKFFEGGLNSAAVIFRFKANVLARLYDSSK